MSLDLEKEQAVQLLCAHYAQDHLSTGELESRFERVYKAEDRATLNTVLDGLPAVGPLVAPPQPLYELAPALGGPMSARSSESQSALPEREKRYVAFFSEVKKEGRWRPAPFTRSRAVLGSVILDLRESEIAPEGLEFDVEAFMGEVKIILPPGIGADVDCSAVMAEIVDKAHAGSPGAPRVRVRGGAFMGTITVITRMPKKERMETWRAQLGRWFGAGDGGKS